MGRNESDANREIMLTTTDQGRHISRYVTRARSAFFPHAASNSTKALLTLDVFEHAALQNPVAAVEWQRRLRAVNMSTVEAVIGRVPNHLMTDTAKRFTAKLLDLNRQRILMSSHWK